MKINTDGVLLACLVECASPKRILDIGTGTGVMALMLAQRFGDATIDAIDLNPKAAKCAAMNFSASTFANRLRSYEIGFEEYFPDHAYDLIVMNPPFFINSLKNTDQGKTMARHAPLELFEALFKKSSTWLTDGGNFQLVWPPALKENCIKKGFVDQWVIEDEVFVHSFEDSPTIRVISRLGKKEVNYQCRDFNIYQKEGVYSSSYRQFLQPFFLNF